MNLPQAKTENIVIQKLDKETLIYDLIHNRAFCLNETAANVFNACDGMKTFDDLKRQYDYSDELIDFSLNELSKKNLLKDVYESQFGNFSRREIIKRIGLGTVAALPVIASLIAPSAINAASTCPPGSPNSSGVATGQPVGSPVTIFNFTCATFPDSEEDVNCDIGFGSRCCSGNASSAGNCTQSGNDINFSCVCSA